MERIRVMMVDDEPLIRKLVKMELNSRTAKVESGDLDASVISRVEMVETFADGPSLMASLGSVPPPDYLLVDMEMGGEPTGGLMVTSRVHERYPDVKIIIFSGRFDAPLPAERAADNASREGEQVRLQRLYDIGRVVMDALKLGASAFVSKNAVGGFAVENVLRAIACLERGERFYFNYPVMLTMKEAAERYFDMVAGHDPAFAVSEQERQLLLLEAAGCTASEISDRLDETDKAIQERQKNLSARLGIVNKSAARVAKAFALGLVQPNEVNFLPRN